MIKTDQRDVKRFQLYFEHDRKENETFNNKIETQIEPKIEGDKPDWMVVGAKVLVKTYHKKQKPKVCTIRTIEWPFIVTLEESPIGAVNPIRILGPVPDENP